MNLKKIIDTKLKELYKESIPQEVKSKIEKELSLINEQKTEYQYLLAYKISEKAKSDGRIMIDRVCGSSYIAYILGITFVNPLKYYIDYEEGFEPLTFDLEFREDYLPVILEYSKEICKEQNIIINSVEDLKKHNIYLNTNNVAYLLEQLEEKTNIKRETIDFNDSQIYEDIVDKDSSLLEDFEMETLENLERKHHQNMSNILNLASVISLSRSTIPDALDLPFEAFVFFPIWRESIYNMLVFYGIEKKLAAEIMYFIARGKQHKRKEKWKSYISIIEEHGLNNKDLESWYWTKINYLYPKAYCVNRAILYIWLTYYKLYYPEDYEEVKNMRK